MMRISEIDSKVSMCGIARSTFLSLMQAVTCRERGWHAVRVIIPTKWIHDRKIDAPIVESLGEHAEGFEFVSCDRNIRENRVVEFRCDCKAQSTGLEKSTEDSVGCR